MAKLLYSATLADGTRTEGVVNAPSAVAAREQLERQGLQKVELRLEAAPVRETQSPPGVDPVQRQQLARLSSSAC
jgi:type II secretory pathway component PulF